MKHIIRNLPLFGILSLSCIVLSTSPPALTAADFHPLGDKIIVMNTDLGLSYFDKEENGKALRQRFLGKPEETIFNTIMPAEYNALRMEFILKIIGKATNAKLDHVAINDCMNCALLQNGDRLFLPVGVYCEKSREMMVIVFKWIDKTKPAAARAPVNTLVYAFDYGRQGGTVLIGEASETTDR
jgi:hypothetical protein